MLCVITPKIVFLLTRPLRDVTFCDVEGLLEVAISTHTPLAGRDVADCYGYNFPTISTHTPLAGRDTECLIYTPIC